MFADMTRKRLVQLCVKSILMVLLYFKAMEPQSTGQLAVSLGAVAETLKSMTDYRTQAPKIADLWPIKNVWSILKDTFAQ